MNIASIYAKRIIEKQVKQNRYDYIEEDFKKYQKGYYWTNENAACYLNISNLHNCNALSVLGTGDQVYDLLARGVKSIDTFDINKLTEYFALGLKKAMILKYDYYSFLEVSNVITLDNLPISSLTNIIMDLLPYMEDKYRKFWLEILNYNYKIQTKNKTNLNLMKMLYIGTDFPFSHINNSYYLLDEYCYNELKWNLENANISFKGVDAIELTKHFQNKKYDIILLSNILDYANGRWQDNWDIEKLEEYLNTLEGITKENGIIFYKYILSYMKDGLKKEKIFHNSSVCEEELKDNIIRIPKVTNSREEDAIILRRVKFDK